MSSVIAEGRLPGPVVPLSIGKSPCSTRDRPPWLRARATGPGAYPRAYANGLSFGNVNLNGGLSDATRMPAGGSMERGSTYAAHAVQQLALTSPFGGSTPNNGYVTMTSRTVVSSVPGASQTYGFDWSGGYELNKVTYPYGGTLRWDYTDMVNGSQKVRGVGARYLKMAVGATEYTYGLTRDVPNGTIDLDDADGKSRKHWEFEMSTANPYYGLVKRQAQYSRLPTQTTMRQVDLTWSATGIGAPYIQRQDTTIDPGTSYVKTVRSEQTVDVRGNLVQSKLYDFGNTTTAKWFTTILINSRRRMSRRLSGTGWHRQA